jgi:hypothetical protein
MTTESKPRWGSADVEKMMDRYHSGRVQIIDTENSQTLEGTVANMMDFGDVLALFLHDMVVVAGKPVDFPELHVLQVELAQSVCTELRDLNQPGAKKAIITTGDHKTIVLQQAPSAA